MALNSSGPLSFGGSTVGQSINLELGVSATALASINSTPFRTLAGVASGQISVSSFYGKSNTTYWISIQFGPSPTTTPMYVYGVAVDTSGNMYSANSISGQRIQKFNSVGASQFVFQTGATIDTPTAVTIDSSNGVYILGRTSGQRNNIVKYNTSGSITWQIFIDNSDRSLEYKAIAVTGTTAVIVAGAATVFDDNPRGAIASYNASTGVRDWNRRTSGTNYTFYGVTTDPSGNIYGVGGLSGPTPFALKTPSTGASMTWANEYNVMAYLQGVYYDASSGNIYARGQINPTSENVLVKLSPTDGSVTWARQITIFNNPGSATNTIVTDSSGNIYIAGTSTTGAVILKFNSSGTLQWQRRLSVSPNGANKPRFLSLTLVSNSVMALGGWFDNTSNLATGLTVELPTDGTLTGTYVVGAYTFTYAAHNSTITTITVTPSASGVTLPTVSDPTTGTTAFTNTSPSVTTTTTTL
jgi:hypothetical protein